MTAVGAEDSLFSQLAKALDGAGFGSSSSEHGLLAWDRAGHSRYVFRLAVKRGGERTLEMSSVKPGSLSVASWPFQEGAADAAVRDLLSRKELLSRSLVILPKPPLVSLDEDVHGEAQKVFALYADPEEAAKRGSEAIIEAARALGPDVVLSRGSGGLAYDRDSVERRVARVEWCGRKSLRSGNVLVWGRRDGIALRVSFPYNQGPVVQAWLPDARGRCDWYSVWAEPFVSEGHEDFLFESIESFVSSFEPPGFEELVALWGSAKNWVLDEDVLWPVFWRRCWDVVVVESAPSLSSGYAAVLADRWMMTFDVVGNGAGFIDKEHGKIGQQQYFLERHPSTGGPSVYSNPMRVSKQGGSWVPDETDFVHLFHPVSTIDADVKVFRETVRSFA